MGWHSGCPVTGRLMHRFDKETHRCVCGRWERGFKPKDDSVQRRPRAECQICERQQAIESSGCLGHHGYRRPGWGCIDGDCMGVDHKPYPATDALEKYLDHLILYVRVREVLLRELPHRTEMPYTYGPKNDRKTATAHKGDGPKYEGRYTIPSFDGLIRSEQSELEFNIRNAKSEIDRVNARIDKAKSLQKNLPYAG